MKITKTCRFDGKVYTMEINCTDEQLAEGLQQYANGELLQDAFHFLSAGEREFLKTGSPPHIWDKMFSDAR